MQNVCDYLYEVKESFLTRPLNEVDSLIFCIIGYFHFDIYEALSDDKQKFLTLQKICAQVDSHALIAKTWIEDFSGETFLRALLQNPRFMLCRVGYFCDEKDDAYEKQFSAVSFLLPNNEMYLAYRGTDNTLTGWKEDFNLAYMQKIPSQKDASQYLEYVAHAYPQSSLYLGGHSKGGNLAQYAAMCADEQTFSRIKKVYDYDGPSFMQAPSERMYQKDYRTKLVKLVPESSIFGMMLEEQDDFHIVAARGFLFFQHAPLNWEVVQEKFVYCESLSDHAYVIDMAMNTWVDQYSVEQREAFIATLYQLIKQTHAVTWSDIEQDYLKSAHIVLRQAMLLDRQTRKMVLQMFADVGKIYTNFALTHTKEKLFARVLTKDLQDTDDSRIERK